MAAKGQGFSKVTALDDAINIMMEITPQFMKEEIEIKTAEAESRLTSKNIYSSVDLPGFYRSAMDGFAIAANDVIGASSTNPIRLNVVGKIDIGDLETPELKNNCAIRIATGAPLPIGADSVIKLEDCEEHDQYIEVVESIHPGKNVAKPDEDVQKGQLIIRENTVIFPWDIAILESVGINSVSVRRKPRIVTLSTGDELVQIGNAVKPGQVVDSNRHAINAWISKMGGEIIHSDQLKDDPEIIEQAIKNAIDTYQPDLIISTGGTSVGTKDYLPEIVEKLGELLVHGISIRPGKPVAIGKLQSATRTVPVIALPGYPLAAFFNFHNFVSPVLHKWTGQKKLWSDKLIVTLNSKIPSKAGYTDFVRLQDNNGKVEVIRITGAGILSSLTNADYILIIPEDVEGYDVGDRVEVIKVRSQ